MNKIIYKYTLPLEIYPNEIDIDIPRLAEFLDAQWQNGQVVLWYELPVDYKYIDNHIFTIIFTGQEFNSFGKNYLATTQTDTGYVLHIYE